MNSQITDDIEPIDRRTSRSICEAVAERLQQILRPEPSRLSSHLEHLLGELRRREEGGSRVTSNQAENLRHKAAQETPFA